MQAARTAAERLVSGVQVDVVDNPDEGRFEARVEGALAGVLYYRERPGGLALVHTEVEDDFEGQGVGSRLVSAALDDIRARDLTATLICRFAAAYVDRHPEYADLVAA
jgi:uncharacterized protein